MNQIEKNKIAAEFTVMAEISGKSFSLAALSRLVEDVSDLPYEKVMSLLKSWGKLNSGFPMPADIRAKITPELSTRDTAIDAVNSAIACVSRFGYTNSEAAKNQMGELAWEAVQRFGGWKQLCETLCFENEGIIRAQLRELTEVVFKKSQRGELNQAPKLPANNAIKNLVNNSLKAIE